MVSAPLNAIEAMTTRPHVAAKKVGNDDFSHDNFVFLALASPFTLSDLR